MKVTLITASYNAAATIENTIKSVLTQDYPNIEYIVIDGASTDGTTDIIRNYSNDITYWVSEPDKGIYNAWNKALQKATGDWIAFLGADDCFLVRTAVTELIMLADQNVDLISSKYELVSDRDKLLQVCGKPWDWSTMLRHMCVAHAGMLHNKKLFEKYGGFNEHFKIAADYEFLLRVGAKQNINAKYLDKVLIKMREGVSKDKVWRVFAENFRIQRAEANLSIMIACKNYVLAVLAYLRRSIINAFK